MAKKSKANSLRQVVFEGKVFTETSNVDGCICLIRTPDAMELHMWNLAAKFGEPQITTAQVKGQYGVTARHLRRLTRNGDIKPIGKQGKSFVWDRHDIEKLGFDRAK